jgi:hypothetical protein
MITLLACQAAAFLAAYALVRVCDVGGRKTAADFCLHAALAFGTALSATSCVFFLALRLGLAPGRGYCVGEMVVFAGLALLLWQLRRRSDSRDTEAKGTVPFLLAQESGQSPGSRYGKILRAAFALSFVSAAAGIAGMIAVEPDGGWDAWNIWNLRARYLFGLVGDWRQAFSPIFRHPDYPLMLSGTIARCWNCLADDPLWVAYGVALGFTLATVVLLAAGVARLRGANQGWLAGLALLGSVAFLQHGASLYADVPLSFFFLAALLLLAIHDAEQKSSSRLLLLAGLAAASAAWTKNEGLLFLAAVLAVRAIAAWRSGGVRGMLGEVGPLLAGAAPVLAVVLLFKASVKTQNDIVAGQDWRTILPSPADIGRIGLILKGFAGGLWHVGKALLIILALALAMLGRAENRPKPALAPLLALVALMFGGYFCIYMRTPYDLAWHLETSVDRLVLHLWPVLLLWVFLSVNDPTSVRLFATSYREPSSRVRRWHTKSNCHKRWLAVAFVPRSRRHE